MPGSGLLNLLPSGPLQTEPLLGFFFQKRKQARRKTGQLSGSSGATPMAEVGEGEECRKDQWEESWAPTTCTLRGSTWVSLAVRPLPVCPKQPPPSRRVLVECL